MRLIVGGLEQRQRIPPRTQRAVTLWLKGDREAAKQIFQHSRLTSQEANEISDLISPREKWRILRGGR